MDAEAGQVRDYIKMLAPRLRMWRVRAMRAGRARALAKAEARHYSALTLRFGFACHRAVCLGRRPRSVWSCWNHDGH